MPHLILLRHAKTESVSATGRDFERGLTERGHRDAAIMGRVLAEAGLTPDLALVSAARRAQETWQEVHAAFPQAQFRTNRTLYLASSEQLARAVETAEGGACLLILGHNPGLHEYALSLCGAAPDASLTSFPTAAAAVFALDGTGRASFQRMLLVRDHGGGAL